MVYYLRKNGSIVSISVYLTSIVISYRILKKTGASAVDFLMKRKNSLKSETVVRKLRLLV